MKRLILLIVIIFLSHNIIATPTNHSFEQNKIYNDAPTYKVNSHNISLSYSTHGTATINNLSALQGDTVFIELQPDYSYGLNIDSSTISGANLKIKNFTTAYFIMGNQDVTLSIYFSKQKKYTISTIQPQYGQISCQKTEAYPNEEIKFTAKTLLSYTIDQIFLSTNENSIVVVNNLNGSDDFTFTMPTADVEISCNENSLSWESLAQRPPKSSFIGDTIQISTPEQLAWVAQYVSNDSSSCNLGFEGKTICIMNDLDLGRKHTAYRERIYQWHAIGRKKDTFFKGTFLGNDYTINNLFVNIDMAESANLNNCDSAFVGLFGNITNASIKHVVMTNAKIRVYSESLQYSSYIGGIVANIYDNSLIQDCAVDVDFYTMGANDANNFDCGGIVANIRSNSSGTIIERCYTTGFLHSRKTVGGIVGWVGHKGKRANIIRHCYSSAMVLSEIRRSGGIAAGLGADSKIEYCYFVGEVKGGPTAFIGGIVGSAYNEQDVKCCYYNSQMSPNVVGIASNSSNGEVIYNTDIPGCAEKLTTKQMIGASLKNKCNNDSNGWNDKIWLFEDGYYPRLQNNYSAQFCSSLLATTIMSLDTTDNILNIKHNFLIGKQNSLFATNRNNKALTFKSKQDKINFDIIDNYNTIVLLYEGGLDTLVINCGLFSQKATAIYVSRFEIGNPDDIVKYGERVKEKRVPDSYIGDLIIWDQGQVKNENDFTVGDSLIYRVKYEHPEQWHVLTLPFDVDKVTVLDKDDGLEYEIVPRTQADEDAMREGGNFWLKTLSDDNAQGAENFKSRWTFVKSTTLEKNVPYIISFKNSDNYYNDATISFYSKTNQTITGTFEPHDSSIGNYYYYYGNNTLRQQTINGSAYTINNQGTYFYLTNEPTIKPFSGYVQASLATKQSVSKLCLSCQETTTDNKVPVITEEIALEAYTNNGVLYIEPMINQILDIYTVGGNLLFHEGVSEGQNITLNFESGVYIIKSSETKPIKVLL